MKLLGPPVQENEELENLETEETSPAPEEAVLSELGLSDDAPEPAGKSEQEVIEEGLDNIAEGKPPEPEKPDSKEITEDDLKPLNSKNPRTNERFLNAMSNPQTLEALKLVGFIPKETFLLDQNHIAQAIAYKEAALLTNSLSSTQ